MRVVSLPLRFLSNFLWRCVLFCVILHPREKTTAVVKSWSTRLTEKYYKKPADFSGFPVFGLIYICCLRMPVPFLWRWSNCSFPATSDCAIPRMPFATSVALPIPGSGIPTSLWQRLSSWHPPSMDDSYHWRCLSSIHQ